MLIPDPLLENPLALTLINTVGAIIVILDGNGRILHLNQAAERKTGYLLDEVRGEYLWDLFITSEDLQAVKNVFAELTAGHFPNEFENDWRTRSGELRRIAWSNTAHVNSDGQVDYVIGTGIDITERKQAEEKLTNAARFPAENPYPILRISADGVLVYANESGLSWLAGLQVKVGEQAPDLFWRSAQQALKDNRGQEIEYEHEGRVLSFILAPFVESGYVNFYGRDTTTIKRLAREREELIAQLYQERTLWKTTVDNMPDLLTVCDTNGRAIFMNNAYSRLVQMEIQTDLPLEEHARHYRICHPDGSPIDPEDLPLQKAALKNVQVRDQEIIQYDAMGAGHVLLWNASPLNDPQGNRLGAVAVGHDITHQRRAEQDLRAKEERLQLALEAASMLAWEWNRETREVQLSNNAKDVLGLDRLDAEDFAGIIHPLDQEKIGDIYRRSLREGENISGEFRIVRPDNGKVRWLEVRGRFHQDTQEWAGRWEGVVVDITERKEAENQLQAYAYRLEQLNFDLESFTSIASHDLQEPLRKIRSFGNRLRVRSINALDDHGVDYLNRMVNAAERLQRMIDDLLVYSKATSAARPFKPVDLNRIAAEVLDDLAILIERTGGRVELGDLAVIEADETQMRQLLQNMIENALKFHRMGIAPVVSVESRTVSNDMVEVLIKDNGIGFQEQYLERIFRPFERLHGRGEYEGSGIGLAICKKIVRYHSGNISATSIPGQGSTFIINLPARQG